MKGGEDGNEISIHALRKESDLVHEHETALAAYFNPRSP